MLEEKIGELIEVIAANTKALQDAYGTTHVSRETKEVSDEVVKEPAKTAKKKTSKKKTAKKTEQAQPQAEEPSETVAVVQTTEAAPVMDAGKVQTHLRAIASQLKDTSKLFALIQSHGGQQFSDLEPAVYPKLIEDAEQLVADGQ